MSRPHPPLTPSSLIRKKARTEGGGTPTALTAPSSPRPPHTRRGAPARKRRGKALCRLSHRNRVAFRREREWRIVMKAGPGGRGSIERRPSPTRERRQERAHYAFSCSLSACLRALIDFGRSSPPRSSPSAFTSSCSLPNSLSNFLCILPASVTLPLLPILVAAHSSDSLMDEMAGSGIVVRAVKEEG
jgi:hypothetical protein